MKKVLLTLALGSLFAVSCSSVKKAESAQTSRAEFLKMKGDWEITSVNYDKGYQIKPFDEGADAQCFVGSHWRLIPNNYSGAYTIKGGGNCPTVTQPIKFEVTRDNEFKFKKLVADTKAKNVTAGYILQIEKQDSDNFTLVQSVPFEGNVIKVYYNFVRTGMEQK